VARLARERSCAKALGASALQPLVDLLHADTVSMRCKEHALKALRYTHGALHACARRRQGMALNPHGSSLLRLGLSTTSSSRASPAVHRLRLLHLMAP
jgi:hypothetical protein